MDIVRNIISDSESSGRCYVPSEYIDDKEEEESFLRNEKNLSDKKLKKYSTKMIQLVNKHQQELVNSLKYWPHETRGPVLAVLEIYRGITSAIQSSHTYPTTVSLSKFHKMLIALYSLYIKWQ